MTYKVEILLPNSNNWFTYANRITAKTEAEKISFAAKREINSRIIKEKI